MLVDCVPERVDCVPERESLIDSCEKAIILAVMLRNKFEFQCESSFYQ